jgi:hypothetical protein
MTREEAKETINRISWDLGTTGMEYLTCEDGEKLREAGAVLGHGSIDYEVAWKQLKHTLIDTKMEIAGMGNNPGLSNVERFNCISDTINLMDQIDGTEYDNRSLYDLWGKQNGTEER